MKIVPAVFDRHAARMLALLNDAVLHTTWVYDCDPHPEAYMREYFDEHAAGIEYLSFNSCSDNIIKK